MPNNTAMLNCLTKFYLGDGAATPTWTEIPLVSFTQRNRNTSKPTVTNANLDSNGTLWESSMITMRGRTFECRTLRLSDGATTPALASVLLTLMQKSERTGMDAEVDIKIVPPNETGYTCVCSVDDCVPYGDNVDDVAQFTFTLTMQGPPAAAA